MVHEIVDLRNWNSVGVLVDLQYLTGSGNVPSKKVYEDDKVIAALDINPATPGHMLVLPKEHYSIMPQLPEELVQHLGKVARHLSQTALRALKAQGTSIFVANGLAAGQRSSHFLLHVIPRSEDDNVGITLPENKMEEKAYAQLKDALKPFVDRAFGKHTQKEASEKKVHPKKSNLDDIADFLGGK